MTVSINIVSDIYAPFSSWAGELSWGSQPGYAGGTTTFKLMLNPIGDYDTWSFSLGMPHADCYLHIRLWNSSNTLVYDSRSNFISTPLGLDDPGVYTWHITGANVGYLENPAVAGTIISAKLNYGGTDYNFGSTVPLNTVASVKLGVRNDNGPSQLRLAWQVFNPSGTAVQNFDNQVYLPSSYTSIFQGGTFTLNAVGTWTIIATLTAWNGKLWVVVHPWNGIPCIVQSEIPTEHTFSSLNVVYNKI